MGNLWYPNIEATLNHRDEPRLRLILACTFNNKAQIIKALRKVHRDFESAEHFQRRTSLVAYSAYSKQDLPFVIRRSVNYKWKISASSLHYLNFLTDCGLEDTAFGRLSEACRAAEEAWQFYQTQDSQSAHS